MLKPRSKEPIKDCTTIHWKSFPPVWISTRMSIAYAHLYWVFYFFLFQKSSSLKLTVFSHVIPQPTRFHWCLRSQAIESHHTFKSPSHYDSHGRLLSRFLLSILLRWCQIKDPWPHRRTNSRNTENKYHRWCWGKSLVGFHLDRRISTSSCRALYSPTILWLHWSRV